MAVTRLVLKGVPVFVEKNDEGHLVDVRVELTEAQRVALYSHVNLEHVDWKTSSTTFFVANELAKVASKLGGRAVQDLRVTHALDSLKDKLLHFISLEAFLNHPSPDRAVLQQLHTQLTELARNTDLIVGFGQTNHYTQFAITVKQLLDRQPSAREIKALLSAADIDSAIPSLGRFIAEREHALIDKTMKKIYKITDGRIKQSLMMHPALKVLSDAKSGIERRSLSLYGVRYVNTRTPVPASQLAYTRMSLSAVPTAGVPAVGVEQKTMSLMPYLKRRGDIERITAILRVCSGTQDKLTTPSRLWSVLVFPAAILEFAVTTAIRLPLHVVSTCVSLLGRAFSWNKFTFGMVRVDKAITRAHDAFSPLKALRNRMSQSYTAEGELGPVVAAVKGQNDSLFSKIMTVFSGDKIAEKVAASVAGFAKRLTSDNVREGIHLFRTKASRTTILDRVTADLRDKMAPDIADDASSTSTHSSSATPRSVEVINPLHRQEAVIAAEAPLLPRPAPWQHADFHSPLDFIDDIAVGLSDAVIDGMFRKSPAAATAFFMLSMASFSALMVPSLFAFSARLEHALVYLPDLLSKHFTGAGAETMQKKVVGCFLEWKAMFFTTELGLNTAQGDFTFLQELLADPEKVLMGLTTLIALGYSLSYIPRIDSPFAAALNFFSGEAHECLGATVPLCGVEYAFLGLKFTLLCSSLLSGSHERTASVEFKHEQLLAQLQGADLFNQGITDAQRRDALQVLVKDYAPDANAEKQMELCDALVQCVDVLRAQHKEIADVVAIATFAKAAPAQGAGMFGDKSHALRERLAQAQQMEALDYKFNSTTEACVFFDDLHRAYRDYNRECKAAGRLDLVIKKDEFMHAFYNKHCYKGSNNALRLLTLPVAWLWRGVKYAVASTETFRSASVRHQVAKSFAKDKAMLLQTVAMCGRIVHAFARAVTYSLRFIASVVASPVMPCGPKTRNAIHRGVAWFRPHAAELPRVARVAYAQAMQKADVGNGGMLASSTRDMLRVVNNDVLHPQPSTGDVSSPVARAADEDKAFHQHVTAAYGHRGFFGAAKAKERLERLCTTRHTPATVLPAAQQSKVTAAIVAEDGDKLKAFTPAPR